MLRSCRNVIKNRIASGICLSLILSLVMTASAQQNFQNLPKFRKDLSNQFDSRWGAQGNQLFYPNPLPQSGASLFDSHIVAAAPALAMNEWTELGPFGWGNFYSFTINPANSNILLAINYGISLLKSMDAGASWTTVKSLEQTIESPFISTPHQISYVPNQPNTVYAMADGLYKSMDNGETWSKPKSHFAVYNFTIDPNNADVIFGYYWDGIYRTRDAGAEWKKLDEQLKRCTEICIDAANSNIIYAGGSEGIWKSSDAGDSWTHLLEGLPETASVSAIAIDPFDHNRVFLGLAHEQGCFMSPNAGDNWLHKGLQGHSIRSLVFDPHKNNQLIAGSSDSLFLSMNGGDNWQNITQSLPATRIAAVAFDPSLVNVIYYSAPYNGLYKSVNYAASWSELKTQARTGIYTISMPANDAEVMYTGTSTAGLLKSMDSGQSWKQIRNEPIGSNIAVHPNNPDILYYASRQGVNKSNDGGTTWEITPTNIWFRWVATAPNQPDVLFAGEKGLYRSTNEGLDWELIDFKDYYIFEPVAFHPKSPDTLYVGVQKKGLFRSLDGGDTWHAANGDMPISTIRAIAISPSNPKVVYISTYQNGVYRTEDAGETWRYAGLGGNDVLTIVVSPLNPDIVIAGCYNYRGTSEGVYLSVDGGQSWSAMRNGLASTEIRKLVIDPGDPRHLYAGTNRHGIWDYHFPETEYDIFANRILSPESTIGATSSFNPEFEIANIGTNTVDNFTVVCVAEQEQAGSMKEIYRNTQSVASMPSYEKKIISFDAFTPQGAGDYLFTFYHTLAGDENHSNDTLRIRTRTALFVRATNYTNAADARGGRGAAAADFDQDGFVDIYQTMYEENQLLHNQQNRTFIDRAHEQGVVNGVRDSRSAGWLDIDNDGDSDLLVLNTDGFALFRNDAGTFSNISLQSGIQLARDLMGIGIGDYNGDGFLDFYATRFGEANLFYSNDGDGTFTNVTTKSGLGELQSNSSSARFFDFNQDGRQDLLVVNHSGDSHLYINNGDTTFTELSDQIGLLDGGNAHHALILDYNNDGMLDIYLINSLPDMPENILYQNSNNTFINVSEEAGVADPGDGQGGVCGDFDNDGFQDIYISNLNGPNVLYHNNGDGTFTNIAEQAAVDDAAHGIGVTTADFDNDGDLDIYLVNDGQANAMFYNTTADRNWLHIKAVGRASNRDAMGAMITVVADSLRMIRLVDGSPGWGSQCNLNAAFGLGNASSVDSIIIRWPSGIIQDTTNVAVNQLLTIVEDATQVSVKDDKQTAQAPASFELNQNYPNPFNSQTTINYQLAKPSRVHLAVFNYLGRQVKVLVHESKNAGRYSIKWDGKNQHGDNVVSGIYFYRIEAGNFINSKKMALIR